MAAWPFWFFYFRMTTRTRVLITCRDEVLVVKGWIGGQKWSLPGGGLHRNEKPFEGALREVLEETGVQLEAKQLEQLGFSSITEHWITISYHCFHVSLATKPNVKRQRAEIAEIEWRKIDNLSVINAELDTLDVIEIWRRTSVSDTI